jgi:hypothetical protein
MEANHKEVIVKATMWINLSLEMDVEAETEDQLYLNAVDKMDDLQAEEMIAAL